MTDDERRVGELRRERREGRVGQHAQLGHGVIVSLAGDGGEIAPLSGAIPLPNRSTRADRSIFLVYSTEPNTARTQRR